MISTNINTSLMTGVVVDNKVDDVQLHKRISFFESQALFPEKADFDSIFVFYKKGIEACLENGNHSNEDVIEALKAIKACHFNIVSYLSYCSDKFLEPVDTTDSFIF